MKSRYWLGLLAGCTVLLAGCGASRLVYPDGLSYIRLGEAMPTRAVFHGRVLQDTLFVEGGYSWPAAVVRSGKGRIYLEGDFVGGSTLNRIRLTTSRYTTPLGIRVGMTWAELLPLAADWSALPIPGYGVADVASAAAPSIHYLVWAPAWVADTVFSIQNIPRDAPVTAIVIM
ncbi:MAG: hypothetical protein SF053_16225 [Bacteroidia bacterium]|nr:hypothetical protein [Bacteroidia bacterium]